MLVTLVRRGALLFSEWRTAWELALSHRNPTGWIEDAKAREILSVLKIAKTPARRGRLAATRRWYLSPAYSQQPLGSQPEWVNGFLKDARQSHHLPLTRCTRVSGKKNGQPSLEGCPPEMCGFRSPHRLTAHPTSR
jgi:hypothetical protein